MRGQVCSVFSLMLVLFCAVTQRTNLLAMAKRELKQKFLRSVLCGLLDNIQQNSLTLKLCVSCGGGGERERESVSE